MIYLSQSDDAKRLAEQLITDASITSLVYDGKGDECLMYVLNALKLNSSIERVHLRCNSITLNSVLALADVIRLNSTVTDVGFIANRWDRGGIKELADSLKINSTITSFSINMIDAMTPLIEALNVNSAIKTFDITNDNKCDVAKITALARMLETNSTLDTLTLPHNGIDDAAMTHVSAALKTNTTLAHIYLPRNNITDTGVIQLARALMQNLAIQTVRVIDTRIENPTQIALREMLRVNSTMTWMMFFQKKVDREFARPLDANRQLALMMPDVFCGSSCTTLMNYKRQNHTTHCLGKKAPRT